MKGVSRRSACTSCAKAVIPAAWAPVRRSPKCWRRLRCTPVAFGMQPPARSPRTDKGRAQAQRCQQQHGRNRPGQPRGLAAPSCAEQMVVINRDLCGRFSSPRGGLNTRPDLHHLADDSGRSQPFSRQTSSMVRSQKKPSLCEEASCSRRRSLRTLRLHFNLQPGGLIRNLEQFAVR